MRGLLIALLVVLVVLVAGDRIAESYAEKAIADRISAELDDRPDVEIKGLSFLLQAVRGDYDEIEVSGERAARDGIGVSDFSAELQGVELPLADVVEGNVKRVPTRVIRGSAVIGYPDLGAAADVSGTELSVEQAGDDTVRITGSRRVLGRTVEASAISTVRLEGKAIVVQAEDYEVGGERAPAAVRAAIGTLFDLRIPLPSLPYRLTVEDLSVTEDGIRLAASARGVVLTR